MANSQIRGGQIGPLDLTTEVTGLLPVANGGTGSATLAGAGIANLTGTQTLSGTRFVPRVVTVSSNATPTLNTDTADVAQMLTLATTVTSMTTNLTGSPNHGDDLLIEIKDNGTTQALTWGAKFLLSGSVPQFLTNTVVSKVHRSFFIYDTNKTAWMLMAVDLIGY